MSESSDLWWEEADKRTYRKPTKEELHEARKVQRERKRYIKKIEEMQRHLDRLSKHPSKVFQDTAGFPYDTRTYIASGRTELYG